jgi:hypothetical protein
LWFNGFAFPTAISYSRESELDVPKTRFSKETAGAHGSDTAFQLKPNVFLMCFSKAWKPLENERKCDSISCAHGSGRSFFKIAFATA